MKAFSKTNAALLFLGILGLGSLQADSLKITGVLGNSGEQGDSLVRFGEKSVPGMGVVYDAKGSLWSGAGEVQLNRYAPDGRLLASYPLPAGGRTNKDTMVLFDQTLLLKLGQKLYSLPLGAVSGTKPELLKVQADRISYSTQQGWAAASLGTKVFWVNAAGETKDLAEVALPADDIEVAPEGVYIQNQGKITLVAAAGAETGMPRTVVGARPQWLNGYWYGHNWHGTIRRFNKDSKQDPGVVLGGGSGSFIGYVPGNYELGSGTGLAWLGNNLYAVAGATGTVQLLEWKPEDKRFELIRRIGSVKNCQALALDGEGRIWYHGGTWNWTDGPDVPLRDGIPGAGSPDGDASQGSEPFGAAMLSNNVLLAPIAAKTGNGTLCSGKLTSRADRSPTEFIPKDGVACTAVPWNKRQELLMVNKTGSGVVVQVDQNTGRPQKKAADVKPEATSPLKELTSLAPGKGDVLWAAADGYVVEFIREGEGWKEKRRWNSWGEDSAAKFGTTIYLAAGEGRLWVADTERNRVLVFDEETGKPLAQAGELDKAGNDLALLKGPKTLSARGNRAVVFDSGNQRVLKLELEK